MVNRSIKVLFGSQTGNAEAIAKRIHSEVKSQLKMESSLHSLGEFKKYKLLEKPCFEKSRFVIVCSTTGNGDAPENADRFWRFIKRKKHSSDMLKGLEYCVLGLGDSNYDKFCYMGEEIHTRMKQLGGIPFVGLGMADDGVGLEEVVEPWIEGLYAKLKKIKSEESGEVSIEEKTEEFVEKKEFSVRIQKSNKLSYNSSNSFDTTESFADSTHSIPYLSKVSGVKYLTSSTSEKQVLHLELKIRSTKSGNPLKSIKNDDINAKRLSQSEGWLYNPGDAIGINCPNPTTMVDEFLDMLRIDGSDIVEEIECIEQAMIPTHIKVPSTIRNIFKHNIDILSTQVTVAQIKELAPLCTDMGDRREMFMLSQVNMFPRQWRVNISQQKQTLFGLLKKYKSCKPDIETLLKISSPLQPRFYSITSSPSLFPDEVHVAFTLVNWETAPPYREHRRGLCSEMYLKEMAKKYWTGQDNLRIPIFLKKTPEFRIPQLEKSNDSGTRPVLNPIIMIGPGTGVAPFRSFVQHRFWQMKQLEDFMKEETNENRRYEPYSDVNMILFHGCRKKDKDFLYGREFLSFSKEYDLDKVEENIEVPTKPLPLCSFPTYFPPSEVQSVCDFKNKVFEVVLACSQEATGGKWYGGQYVQDSLFEYADDIMGIMTQQKGYMYLCGDAQGMASGVHRSLIQILCENGGMTQKEAEECISNWEKEGRYQKDVWTS